MEDPSVAVISLTRKELLVQLGLEKSKHSTSKLQDVLKNWIEKNYPIKDYINRLEKIVVAERCKKIATNANLRHHEKKKRFITEYFFENCEKAPLSSLKFFMGTGRLPDNHELDQFYENNFAYFVAMMDVATNEGDSTENEGNYEMNDKSFPSSNKNEKEEHATESLNLSENEKEEHATESMSMSENEEVDNATESMNHEEIDEDSWINDFIDSDMEDSLEEISSMSQDDLEAPHRSFTSNDTSPGARKNQEQATEANPSTESTTNHPVGTFLGVKYENESGTSSQNACFRNGILNALLAIEAYRRRALESSGCQCLLCKHCKNVLNNLDSVHNNAELRIMASRLNNEFKTLEQQDAQEFLGVLIEQCTNLQELLFFSTQEIHTCPICWKETTNEDHGFLKSCQIDQKKTNESTFDMLRRTALVEKECQGCGNECNHQVKESFNLTSDAFIIWAKRFKFLQNRKIKITTFIKLSLILEIDHVTYYLKAVLKHSGATLKSGHYTTALNLEEFWMIRNDKEYLLNLIENIPKDGYLYFYEKAPLLVGVDLLLSLQLEFDVQRDQANAQHAARNLKNNSKPSDKPKPNMKSPINKEKTVDPKSGKETCSNSSEFNDCSTSTPDLQESVEDKTMKKKGNH